MKSLLMFLNRCNLVILRKYFKRKIKRRIRWQSNSSIHNGMIYPSYQILDRVYWVTNRYNFIIHAFFVLYVMISYFPIVFFTYLHYFYTYLSDDEEKEPEKYVPAYIKHNYSTIENFTSLEDLSPYIPAEDESEFIYEQPIKIIVDSFSPTHKDKMNRTAVASLNIENAGGTSEISEAWSIHHLMNKLGGISCYYEMEILYWCDYKIMDYILVKPDERIGVSVVRAICRSDLEFTYDDALRLVIKKINGLVISRKSVNEGYTFYRSILHIWSPKKYVTDLLVKALNSGDFNPYDLQIIGTLDIWITESEYNPIFNNGHNKPYAINIKPNEKIVECKFNRYKSFKSTHHPGVCEKAYETIKKIDGAFWIATEKVHGANFSCWCNKDGDVQWNKRNEPLNMEEQEKFFRSDIVVNKYKNVIPKIPKILDVPWIQVFGEICGGKYNGVILNGIPPVQNEIEYSPNIEYIIFDILTPNGFIPYEEVISICKELNLYYVPIYASGTLEEMKKLNKVFQSKIHEVFGFESINRNNEAEGYMIRPTSEPNTKHIIIKHKNPRFLEGRHEKKEKIPKTKIKDQKYFEYRQYINDNRFNSLRSKIGFENIDSRFIGLLVKDAIIDIIYDDKNTIKVKKDISRVLFNYAEELYLKR